MADFKLDGRMKVKSLKAEFKMCFGATLRVYKSETCKGALADDNATLASIRAEGKKGGELVVGGNLKVGNFEKKIAELYGIGVQVANADDSKLADNDITLSKAGTSSAYEVILVDAGTQTLSVFKTVKELLIVSLSEAMNIVRSAPVTLKTGVSASEAKRFSDTLKEVGAKVKIK